jgi:long-subunit acyl-CoA synthetase (AMP-forming)
MEDGWPSRRGEPKITTGYGNGPDKTARNFHGDVLRTGDIGHLDANGSFSSPIARRT